MTESINFAVVVLMKRDWRHKEAKTPLHMCLPYRYLQPKRIRPLKKFTQHGSNLKLAMSYGKPGGNLSKKVVMTSVLGKTAHLEQDNRQWARQ